MLKILSIHPATTTRQHREHSPSRFPARRGSLSCTWTETGNRRQPLACVWIDRDLRSFAGSDPFTATGDLSSDDVIPLNWALCA